MRQIGIIGSRSRDTEHDFLCCVELFLKVYEEGDIIISGGCPKGGDSFAEIIAKAYDIPIVIFPADWDKYGKSAGFIRNTKIADHCDFLIALVTKDRNRCKGTMDTVNKAKDRGRGVILDSNEEEFNPENICQ